MEACIKNLLQLCHENPSSDVVAIRKKYSQHKVTSTPLSLLLIASYKILASVYSPFLLLAVQVCSKEALPHITTARTLPLLGFIGTFFFPLPSCVDIVDKKLIRCEICVDENTTYQYKGCLKYVDKVQYKGG